jgi:hypothetical protein
MSTDGDVRPLADDQLGAVAAVAGAAHGVALDPEEFLQALARVGVVLEQDDPEAAGDGRRRVDDRGRGPQRRQRQLHHELRAAALARAGGAHRAAVQLDDVPDEREAHAQTAACPGERLVALDEQVEQAWHQARRDADAVVPHPDDRPSRVLASFDGDLDQAVLRRVLDRIDDEVRQHLLQPHRVAAHVQRAAREIRLQLMPAPGHGPCALLYATPHQFADVHGLPLDRELPVHHPRDVEKIVHDAGEAADLALDQLAVARALPRVEGRASERSWR